MMTRLELFDNLQVGNVVTHISAETGITRFESMGYDPKLHGENRTFYGYFLESFGRERVERWYVGCLASRCIYFGYDRAEALKIERLLLLGKIASIEKQQQELQNTDAEDE